MSEICPKVETLDGKITRNRLKMQIFLVRKTFAFKEKREKLLVFRLEKINTKYFTIKNDFGMSESGEFRIENNIKHVSL